MQRNRTPRRLGTSTRRMTNNGVAGTVFAGDLYRGAGPVLRVRTEIRSSQGRPVSLRSACRPGTLPGNFRRRRRNEGWALLLQKLGDPARRLRAGSTAKKDGQGTSPASVEF